MQSDDAGPDQAKAALEALISYSGDAPAAARDFDLALFKSLNERYASRPVVPAPRAHDTAYTTGIGETRAAMLERKFGLRGRRVLELGCGDGMLSRVMARDYGCEVVGVDIQAYDAWRRPTDGNLTRLVHDVTQADNFVLGTFDRVVSFAVLEHVVHPHAALEAVYDLLRPGGAAYIYANLYRGAKASHRYREVFFPWPHLLFEASVWRAFYTELQGEPSQAAWVNKLTYDQYLAMAGRIGFETVEHFPSPPFFDEDFYKEFEFELAAYPKFDLMHDFIHLVLRKPDDADARAKATVDLLAYPPLPANAGPADHDRFWRRVEAGLPNWKDSEQRWRTSRTPSASAIGDEVPWVTFAAIDYLDAFVQPDHKVFEWGSGGSTLFFAKRARHVVSIEHDEGWFEQARVALASAAGRKIDYRLVRAGTEASPDWRFQSGARGWEQANFEAYVRAIEPFDDDYFDVVSVDGRARMGCLEIGARKVAPGGLLLLDNSNYPRYAERVASIRKALKGWEEIDLSGPGPYSRTPAWATTIWRRPRDDAHAPPKSDQTFRASMPVPALRKAISGRPLRPYEQISYWPEVISPDNVRSACRNGRISLFGLDFEIESLEINSNENKNRTQGLFEDSFDNLDCFLNYYNKTQEKSALDVATKFAITWIQQKDSIEAGSEREALIQSDTAVGNRLYRLAYMIDAASRLPDFDDLDFEILLKSYVDHLEVAADPARPASRTNHGIFEALTIMFGAARFKSCIFDGSPLFKAGETAFDLGRQRLLELAPGQFAQDGTHREHSAFYQIVVTAALAWAARNIGDKPVKDLLDKILADANVAMPWFVDARHQLANLGDTDLEANLDVAGLHRSSPQPSAFLAEGGYWFVKEARADGAYLAQTCSFHSRVHKQADSGAFLWRDRGKHILIDAGRYGYVGRTPVDSEAFRNGYWYADARRRYVESTLAHNTVRIDRQDHPRFRSRPYGSGMVASADFEGIYASECSVRNLQHATHHRLLAMKPGNWLVCLDTVRAKDGLEHLVEQNFHLHPDWKLVDRSQTTISFEHPDGDRLYANCLLADAVVADAACGRGDPETDDPEDLYGWWSRRHLVFEPCTSFRTSVTSNYASVATLFTFDPVEIDRAYTGFNASRRRYRLRWAGPAGGERLILERRADSGRQSLSIETSGAPASG